MGIFKSPKQPDPVATAKAQGEANKEAAIASQELNLINQVGPDGTLTYQQTGTSGKGTPQYTATTALDPLSQQARDLEKQADISTNKLANELVTQASGSLAKPSDFSEEAIQSRVAQISDPRLEDDFARDETRLRENLINRGVREGSQAFEDAYRDYSRSRTDARQQANINYRQQAIGEIPLGRNQTINEIGALLGTGQISNPQFVSTPQSGGFQAGDLQGNIYRNYQGKVQSQNAALGGLFGLGSAAIRAGGSFFRPGA